MDNNKSTELTKQEVELLEALNDLKELVEPLPTKKITKEEFKEWLEEEEY